MRQNKLSVELKTKLDGFDPVLLAELNAKTTKFSVGWYSSQGTIEKYWLIREAGQPVAMVCYAQSMGYRTSISRQRWDIRLFAFDLRGEQPQYNGGTEWLMIRSGSHHSQDQEGFWGSCDTLEVRAVGKHNFSCRMVNEAGGRLEFDF